MDGKDTAAVGHQFLGESTEPVIPGYNVLGKLGEGGMGVVYKAQQEFPSRIVALKIIRPDKTNSLSKERFCGEINAQSECSKYKNIVTVYEAGEHDGLYYFTMEYLEGQSLAEKMEEGKLHLKEILHITYCAAKALYNIHQHGIYHRDIKPSNIWLEKDGNIKLLDFGIAIKQDEKRYTKTGESMGTIFYMAPEQLDGVFNVQSEVYSLGIVMFEMLTGELPYPGKEQNTILGALSKRKKLPKPSEINVAVPSKIDTLCCKAIDMKPEKRYQNMEEFAEEIKKQNVVTKRRSSRLKQTKSPNNFQKYTLVASICFVLLLSVCILAFTLPKTNSVKPEILRKTARIVQLNNEVNNLLDLVYNSNLDTETPKADAILKIQTMPNIERNKLLQNLKNVKRKGMLFSGGAYQIGFKCKSDAYVYIFQIDSGGNFQWLYPKNPFSPQVSIGNNPVNKDKEVYYPGTKSIGILDDQVGVEHFYVIFVKNRWQQLEEYLGLAAQSEPKGEIVQQENKLLVRGTTFIETIDENEDHDEATNIDNSIAKDFKSFLDGVAGVLVVELTLKHTE